MLSKFKLFFTLVLVNLAPLSGILFFGWDWREIIIFYWLGNITVGVLTVLGILRAPGLASLFSSFSGTPNPVVDVSITSQGKELPLTPQNAKTFVKSFMVLFFCAHYGIFTFVHGVFVFALTSGALMSNGTEFSNPDTQPLHLGQILGFWLITFITQIVLELLYKRSDVTVASAYTRIIVLHLTIIFGAWLITAMNWPAATAVLLVLVNFTFELNRMLRSKASAVQPVLSASQV